MKNKDNCEIISQSRETIHCEDQLDRCEQVNQIKARILQLQRNQAITRQRKQRFLMNRQERIKAGRDVSLSVSNNVSAIFSTGKSIKNQNQMIKKYQNIANITQQQNENLKQQNQYLLGKLKRMKEKQKKFAKIAEKAQKYKTLYQDALNQLSAIKEECQAYKAKAQEMKKIALLDVGKLEHKLLPFIKTMNESQTTKSEAVSRGQGKILEGKTLNHQYKET